MEAGRAKPLFSLSVPSVSSAGRFPGSRKPLSGISAGGNRCRRAGNRSLLHIFGYYRSGRTFLIAEDVKEEEEGEVGNISSCVIAPKPQGGRVRERDEGVGGGLKPLGACGHLRRSQRPCEPLDSFSGLSVGSEEREAGGEKGVRGEVKGQPCGGGFYASCW